MQPSADLSPYIYGERETDASLCVATVNDMVGVRRKERVNTVLAGRPGRRGEVGVGNLLSERRLRQTEIRGRWAEFVDRLTGDFI